MRLPVVAAASGFALAVGLGAASSLPATWFIGGTVAVVLAMGLLAARFSRPR